MNFLTCFLAIAYMIERHVRKAAVAERKVEEKRCRDAVDRQLAAERKVKFLADVVEAAQAEQAALRAKLADVTATVGSVLGEAARSERVSRLFGE